MAKLGDILGRFPIGYPRIVQTRRHKDRWIVLGLNLIIRRVAQDQVESIGIFYGVTPFGPLPFSVAYEYNEEGYPTKITSSALGETSVSTVEYKCE